MKLVAICSFCDERMTKGLMVCGYCRDAICGRRDEFRQMIKDARPVVAWAIGTWITAWGEAIKEFIEDRRGSGHINGGKLT